MFHRQTTIVGARLTRDFYRRADVIQVGRDLLGQYLFTRMDGRIVTGGRIVETEAYEGVTDRASHAYGNRRTARTAVMYSAGGVAYVYLCYGLHALFNIITNVEGIPHAVLIRALEPSHGIPLMLRRRRKTGLSRALTAGPGVLTQALGIEVRHSGLDLSGNLIWLEKGSDLSPDQIIASARVGVEYAGADAKLPWRFRIRASSWVSLAK